MNKWCMLFCGVVIIAGTTAFGGDSTASINKIDSATASSTNDKSGTTAMPKELLLSLDELAAYNGQDGKPAYVAVDGVIYDVSNVKAWKKGKHHGNTAGNDVSAIIKKKSPHGLKVLKKLPVVGKLKT